MTHDDIVVMAVNAGANAHFVKHHIAFIEKLAKLVEDKTRRDLREEIVYTWVPPHFVDIAVEAEREECAQICENFADQDSGPEGICIDYHAYLIRARSKK